MFYYNVAHKIVRNRRLSKILNILLLSSRTSPEYSKFIFSSIYFLTNSIRMSSELDKDISKIESSFNCMTAFLSSLRISDALPLKSYNRKFITS